MFVLLLKVDDFELSLCACLVPGVLWIYWRERFFYAIKIMWNIPVHKSDIDLSVFFLFLLYLRPQNTFLIDTWARVNMWMEDTNISSCYGFTGRKNVFILFDWNDFLFSMWSVPPTYGKEIILPFNLWMVASLIFWLFVCSGYQPFQPL